MISFVLYFKYISLIFVLAKIAYSESVNYSFYFLAQTAIHMATVFKMQTLYVKA